jgi:hypothetical protein
VLEAELTAGPQCSRKDYFNEKFQEHLQACSKVPQPTASTHNPIAGDRIGDQGVDGKVIIKRILNKQNVRVWASVIMSGYVLLAFFLKRLMIPRVFISHVIS